MPTPTPEQAVEAVTWLHRVRTAPGRWWVTAALALCASVGVYAMYKRGAAWVNEMEAQKAVKGEGAAARFEAIEASVTAVKVEAEKLRGEVRDEFRDTRQEIRELRADVRRAMRQHVAQTDVDEEAAQRVADSLPPVPLRCGSGCASADPLPPIGVRVPAAGAAVGRADVGDRGQLTGGR